MEPSIEQVLRDILAHYQNTKEISPELVAQALNALEREENSGVVDPFHPDSNFIKHALREFRAAGWTHDDGKWIEGYQRLMCAQVCDLLRMFASHGHSGMSAPYATNLFNKLSRFEPLVPLTGEDGEWGEPYDTAGTQQNKRCSHVFREKQIDGSWFAYDIEGRVFRTPDGHCYTNSGSRVEVVFPYTPTRQYVDVPE